MPFLSLISIYFCLSPKPKIMPDSEKLETLQVLITVKNLSDWIKISSKVIYRLIDKKEIPYIKIGGKYLFDKQQILDWLKLNSVMVSNN